MNILIRNIDPMFVNEIDNKSQEITKRIGRNFSRNEYIQMLIKNDCELRLTQLKEERFDVAVKFLTETLNRQESTLQSFIDSNSRLFQLLTTGSDLSEGVDEL